MKALSLKQTIVGMLLAMGLVFGFGLAAPISAATTDFNGDGEINAEDDACEALVALDPNSDCRVGGTNDSESTVIGIARTAINIMSLIVGIVSVIVIIVSGFRFVTSGGDSANVSGARNGIIYAIVGLIVVILAQAIVAFVLNRI